MQEKTEWTKQHAAEAAEAGAYDGFKLVPTFDEKKDKWVVIAYSYGDITPSMLRVQLTRRGMAGDRLAARAARLIEQPFHKGIYYEADAGRRH